jgi:hypothetical protein
MCYGRVNASYYANGGVEHPRIVRIMGKGGMMPCRDGHVCIHAPEDYQWAARTTINGRWTRNSRLRLAECSTWRR